MKNILFIATLVISIGLIIFLYQRLTATEAALRTAEKHFADCQQVTFQLQNQLSQEETKKGAAAVSTTAPKR